jgi:hypothetical protein
MQQLSGTPVGADHRSRLTAPLPPAAVSAMRSLERRLATPDVVRAVTVYETAAVHAAELAAKAATGVELPALDVRSWEFAEELMAGSLATLAAAGMLHLVQAEHEKVKDPLPIRPRGPHPQRVTAAV